jgi:hypothetical protein
MGVYSSNTYNPLGSIQAALNNVNERNRIKNEYWKRKGEIWSNFANQMGKIGGRVVDGLTAGSETNGSLEARLAALETELKEAEEAERIQAIQDKYNEQVAQRQAVNQYLTDPYNRIQPTVTEPWDGYNDIDIEDNLYRKALNGGIYA